MTYSALGGEYKAKQNRSRKLGVLPKFQIKNCLKIHEYPSTDDSEGKKDFMELNRSKAIFRSTLSVIFCILLWLVWLNNAHFGYGLKDLLPLPKWCSCLWMWELMTSWVGQGIWISIMCDSRHFRVRAQNTCNGWLRDNVWPEMATLKLTSQKLHSLVILTVTHALSWLKNSQILTCNNILDWAKSSPVNHRLYLFV